jgi:hypothetical protein
MDDVSMTAIGLCLNEDAQARGHDRSPRLLALNKMNKVKHEHNHVINKHA